MGGPRFLTDDPVPVDCHQSELNVYSAYDETRDGRDSSFPDVEFNYGGLRDVQRHIGIPFARSAADGGPNEQGIGDVEVGAKYRLVRQSETSPQIAIYPMAVLPTGDSKRRPHLMAASRLAAEELGRLDQLRWRRLPDQYSNQPEELRFRRLAAAEGPG